MDIQRPHDIRPASELPKAGDPLRHRWIPLSNEQAEHLSGLTEEQRHQWIRANAPTDKRLSSHLNAIGLPLLAARAAMGDYSDFRARHPAPKLLLLQELAKAKQRAVRKKGEHSDKAFAIADLEKLVRAGEYDDNKAESDAWAREQTGEVRQLLDQIGIGGG